MRTRRTSKGTAHLLRRKAVERHAEEVVEIAVGSSIIVASTIVVRVRSDVGLSGLGEGTEVLLAELSDDDGAFAVGNDELLRDDHLDEASLVREAVVCGRELVDEESLRFEALAQDSHKQDKQADLALVVVVHANVEEVAENLFGSRVLLDLASRVEADHVANVELARDLESLLETVLLNRLLALVGERDDEVNGGVRVVDRKSVV